MKARRREKPQKSNFCAIFHLSLVIFSSLLRESRAAGACDRSRRVFEGVSSGEITDGLHANYTQVGVGGWDVEIFCVGFYSDVFVIAF
jgi:hypothetical protein